MPLAGWRAPLLMTIVQAFTLPMLHCGSEPIVMSGYGKEPVSLADLFGFPEELPPP